MPEVIVRKGEPVDRALKRLKNKLDSEGIMDEVRRLRVRRPACGSAGSGDAYPSLPQLAELHSVVAAGFL
jgi:hypothetical protein